jgi:PKD repeat protein
MAYVLQSSPVVVSKSFPYSELGHLQVYTITQTFNLDGSWSVADNRGRKVPVPMPSIAGVTGIAATIYQDTGAQLVKQVYSKGSYSLTLIHDFSARTDGGAKISVIGNLPSATTLQFQFGASVSLAQIAARVGDGYVGMDGNFYGLGFDWSDLTPAQIASLKPTCVNGLLSLTVPAQFEIDPATVGTGTGTAWAMPSNQCVPVWIAATNLWWMIYCDGTNVVYQSCATLTGTWATKATVLALATINYAVCSDGTYIHIAYQTGATIHYIQCTPTSGGSIGAGTDRTIVASGAVACYPTVCVTTDSYVAIGYAITSNYPRVIKNSNLNSNSAWVNASGFPATITSTAMYAPVVAPAPSGAVNVVYATSSVMYFRTVSSTGTVGGQETASLSTVANIVAGANAIGLFVDSSGKTTIVYCDTSYNVKTRNRSSGGTWDGSEVTHQTMSAICTIGIQQDTATGNIYLFWDDIANSYVRYDWFNGTSWAGAATLSNESSDGGLNAFAIGGPLTSQNGQVAVCYMTKATSPYNIKVAGLALTTTWAITGTVAISASVSATVLDNANWIVAGTVAIAASVSATVVDTHNYVLTPVIAVAASVSATVLDNANWIVAGTVAIAASVSATVIDTAPGAVQHPTLDLHGGIKLLNHLEEDALFLITNSGPVPGTVHLSAGANIHFDNLPGAGFDPNANIILIIDGTSGEPCTIDSASATPANAWTMPGSAASVTATYCTFTNCQYTLLPTTWSLGRCTFNWIASVAPVASFTADLTTLQSPNQTTFTDTSSGAPTVFLWNFGDGRISTDQNPVHQWNRPGTFYPTLKVTNGSGSSTSAPLMVTVTNPQVNMAMTIGGTDITPQYQTNSLSITGAIGMRKTGSLTLHNKNTFRPATGAPVIITDSNTANRIFGGLIWDYSEYNQELNTDTWFDVNMTSFDGLADRHQVNEIYNTPQTADLIIKDLVAKYLVAEGVTTVNVEVGPVIDSAFWAMVSCASCFDDLCNGNGFSWYIDDYKDLHYYNTASLTCPVSLTDTSNNYRALTVKRSMADYINAEWIQGADAVSDPHPETFIGNGQITTFTLSKACVAVPTVTLNGVSQTVGISQVDVGKQWYWSSGSQAITQDQSGTPIGASDVLVINYSFAYPNLEYADNPAEISNRAAVEGTTGRYEAFKSISSLISPTQNLAYGAADIAKFGRVSEVVTYESDNPTIQAGQVQSAEIIKKGLSGSYLITSVTVAEVDKAILRRTVTAQGGQFLSQWVNYFRSLASKSSKPVSIGSGSVLLLAVQGKETLVFSDSITVAQGPNVNALGTGVLGFFSIG